MTEPVEAALPAGFGVALAAGTRRIDDGTVLVGGVPLRLLRLTPAGARLVDEWCEGAPVADGAGGQRLARRLLDGGLAHPRPGGAKRPYGPLDVSVVIPFRGEVAELALTLAALGPTGEVIVVDDGSVDPQATAAVARATGARLLRHERSHGPGSARETGWRAAQRPVIAFVDAEVEPARGWLDGLLAHLADPLVAAVAPRVVPIARPSTPRWLERYEQARSPLDLGAVEAVVRPGSPVSYVPTAVLVVRRSALEAVGGFDEDLRFGEDVDLVWRLGTSGFAVRYEPATTASHPSRTGARAWLRQRHDYGRSAGRLGVRHGAAVAPLRVSGWSAAAWGLVVGGAPVAGAVVGAGTTVALAPKLRTLRHPIQEALRLAGKGHLYAGLQVASALRRAWLPAALLLTLHRRSRPALLAAAVVPPAIELVQRRPGLDPVRWTALRLVDDGAYCVGLWRGAVETRSISPLIPWFTGRFPPPREVE